MPSQLRPDGTLAMQAASAIRQLKARYCQCVDGKRWDELRGLFTPDAVTQTGARGQWRDRDAFVDKVALLFATATTRHSVEYRAITLQLPAGARGVWTMQDRLCFVDHTAPGGLRYWQGSGLYHEDYVQVDGRWLIRSMRLERTDMPAS